MEDNLDFILKAASLKDTDREGWVLRGVEDYESVADHSWSTALLCLTYHSEVDGISLEKTLKIAIIHDIAELETGDFAQRIHEEERGFSQDEKQVKEQEAIQNLSSLTGNLELESLWEEYEHRSTLEAKFVSDMSLIDQCLQAVVYEKGDRYDPNEMNENFKNFDYLMEFFATAEDRLQTDISKKLFYELKEKYEEIVENKY